MIIEVEFESGGKSYCYNCPIQVCLGDIVLVDVFGTIKAVKVLRIGSSKSYDGPIRTIWGVAYSLEHLSQPEQKEKPTLWKRLVQCFKILSE